MNRPARRAPALVPTLLVAALLAALLVPAAEASPTWSGPAEISDAGYFGRVDIATDAAGDAVAVWSRWGDQPDARGSIEAATRPAGGAWSHPVVLDESAAANFVAVASDGTDVFTVVWTSDVLHRGTSAVRTSRLTSIGGVWSDAQALSEPGAVAVDPQVAAGPGGDVAVTWTSVSGGTVGIHAAYRPAGGRWVAPAEVSEAGVGASGSDVAVDTAGTATAVWWASGTGGHGVVQSSLRTRSGAWSAPVDVSPEGVNSRPALAAGATGTATAVWAASGGSGIQSAVLSGGDWSAPVTLADRCFSCLDPTIAENQAGQAVAGWHDSSSSSGARAATRSPGGSWSPAVTLDEPARATGGAFVSIDSTGLASAVWLRPDSSALAFSRHRLGGEWSAPGEVTGSAGAADWEPRIVADDEGDVVVTWLAGPDRVTVRAAGLDAAGPRLASLSVPAHAETGQGLTFSARATDDWSSVASYSWAFGDGTAATGTWVTHTYTTPGTYAATLTVTDTVGNTTVRRTSIVMTAPPPATEQPPAFTLFELPQHRIRALDRSAATAPETSRLRIGLTSTAVVRLTVRSTHRHLVDGRQRYVKVTLTRRRPAGRSTITLRGRLATIKLPADTYRIVGTATNKAGTSPQERAWLRVVAP